MLISLATLSPILAKSTFDKEQVVEETPSVDFSDDSPSDESSDDESDED